MRDCVKRNGFPSVPVRIYLSQSPGPIQMTGASREAAGRLPPLEGHTTERPASGAVVQQGRLYPGSRLNPDDADDRDDRASVGTSSGALSLFSGGLSVRLLALPPNEPYLTHERLTRTMIPIRRWARSGRESHTCTFVDCLSAGLTFVASPPYL